MKKLLFIVFAFIFVFGVLDCLETTKPNDVNDANEANEAPVFTSNAANNTYLFTATEDIYDTHILGTISATDPDGDPLTYSIITDNHDLFEIGSNNGEISLKEGYRLDYEMTNNYQITVQVSDGNFVMTVEVTIEINNVNDNSPVFSSNAYTFIVAENIGVNTVMGRVSATDADGDTLTYSIITNNDGLFGMGSNNGEISMVNGKSLNYEANTSHQITVQASDGQLSATAAVTIKVSNVNDNAPTFSLGDYTFTAAENIAAESAIGQVSASDLDGLDGDALSFTIMVNDNGLFEINKNNGLLSLAEGQSLDFEVASNHHITVQASDGQLSATAAVTIKVSNVNDNAPTFSLGDYTFTAAENIASGSAIGQVSANDLDGLDGDALSFTIMVNDNGLFEINKNNGLLSLVEGQSLDFEEASNHHITVQASDGQLSATAAVTINVSNINDNAPTFSLGDYTFTAAENIASESAIGQVSASDLDGDALNFTIMVNDNGLFEINKSNGILSLVEGQSLDFEVASNHQITVQASDGQLSATTAVTINVSNVNDNAPTFSLGDYTFTAAENIASGSAIGQVSASDLDGLAGDALNFTIMVNDNGLFEINKNNGLLSLAEGQSLDFEVASNHQITVQASDGQLSATAAVTIKVTNVNDNAPTFSLGDYTFTAAENIASGSAIGQVSASDLDGDALSFTIMVNDNGLFEINKSNSLLSLVEGQSLDFEVASNHHITVQVSDGQLSATAAVTINVSNVNDNAPTFSLSDYTFTAAENIASESAIGQVSASDLDGDAFNFTIMVNDNGLFEINRNNGILSLAEGQSLDFEEASNHQITLQVSDGQLSATASVTINVSDNNSIIEYLHFTVAENIDHAYSIGVIEVTNQMGNGMFNYVLINHDEELFEIGDSDGILRLLNGKALDFETTTNHAVTVQAYDNNDLVKIANITIEVTNVNEMPIMPEQSFVFDGNTPTGTLVANDPEGDVITYSFIDNINALLSITSDGIISFDWENFEGETSSYTVTVQASDGLLFSRDQITVQVDLDPHATNAQNIKSNWFLVFNDEFEGTELNTNLWEFANWFSYLEERRKNVSVTNGHLSLILRTITNTNGELIYVGTKIRTKFRPLLMKEGFEKKFGYFEAKVKFPYPVVTNLNTGFYLWRDEVKNPGNEGRDGTEMDIYEIFNAHRGVIQHALHWQETGLWKADRSSVLARRKQAKGEHNVYNGDWHTLALLWTPTNYIFYIDDEVSWSTNAGGVSQVAQYIELGIGLALWGERIPPPAEILPATNLIDYVRVYDAKPLAE